VSGLVGIIGEGGITELQAMAERMPYRGAPTLWSPGSGVWLGELSWRPRESTLSRLALDVSGPLYNDPALGREHLERDLAQREIDAVRDITGLFALAYWDDERHTLLLACDRQGYKGLYFARLPGRIAFATDYKALLALPDCPASLNRQVLQTYLVSRSFSSMECLLESVEPVGRAYTLTIRRDLGTEHEPYWEPQRRFTHRPHSLEEAASSLRSILEAVLRKQLHEHAGAGIALSGGLDSAAVLALARHVRPDLQINAYTVGHSDADPEILRAQRVAKHFGTAHHACVLPPEQIPAELERYVWLTEDLTGREEAVLQQVVTVSAGAREKVLLAGHGADAALAGMPRHRLMWLRDHTVPPLRSALHELFVYTQIRHRPSSWLGRQLVGLTYRDRPEMPRVHDVAPRLEDLDWPSLGEYRRAMINALEGLRFHEPADAVSGLTMAAPFLDPAVIDFALDCPTQFMISARQQKRVLRAAMRDLLPPEVYGQRKTIQRLKHDAELSDVLDAFASELRLRESLHERGILDGDYVKRLQQRRNGEAYSEERLHILWALICARLWIRIFLDQRGKVGGDQLRMAREPMSVPASASSSQPMPSP
jgi:asparagine synthase (glutamine-hydrolysing)